MTYNDAFENWKKKWEVWGLNYVGMATAVGLYQLELFSMEVEEILEEALEEAKRVLHPECSREYEYLHIPVGWYFGHLGFDVPTNEIAEMRRRFPNIYNGPKWRMEILREGPKICHIEAVRSYVYEEKRR